MLPVVQRLSAAGFSPWIPVPRVSRSSFKVGFGVKLSSGASLTYSVQHTMDYFYNKTHSFSISRTTTTATVTRTNHGLSVGDWTLFSNCAAPFDGEYQVVTVADANTFTFTVANSGAASVAHGAGLLQTARVFSHADIAAETASADGNYEFPPMAIRFIITTYVSGFADFTVIMVG